MYIYIHNHIYIFIYTYVYVYVYVYVYRFMSNMHLQGQLHFKMIESLQLTGSLRDTAELLPPCSTSGSQRVSLKDRDGAVTWVMKPASCCLKTPCGKLMIFCWIHSVYIFFILPSTSQHFEQAKSAPCAQRTSKYLEIHQINCTSNCQAPSHFPTTCSN